MLICIEIAVSAERLPHIGAVTNLLSFNPLERFRGTALSHFTDEEVEAWRCDVHRVSNRIKNSTGGG